jgi:purine-binding chemotaxis protein CheW
MANTRHNKYLTFMLANEGYGIDIQKVREINEMMAITPIPEAPPYMKGIINLRGKIIPVIDLRERFGMIAAPSTKDNRNCIIVVEIETSVGKHSTGLIVDAVSDVSEIKPDQIEANVELCAGVSANYITGIARVNNQVKILLNIDKVLSSDVVESIQESISIRQQ